MATALRSDTKLLGAFWDAVVQPGEVHEVRIPKSRRGPARFFGTVSGYFNDRVSFVNALSGLTGRDAEAVYITLNPTAPDLRARADNHLKNTASSTTADDQITRRRNLLIDVDPSRASDISSTDQERDAALALRDSIYEYLQVMGWPEPVAITMSGNGGGLIYRIDLPNDDESRTLVSRLLEAVGALFDTEAVQVDQTVANPARITKVVGTVAAKGDDVPDLGRRWRLSTGTFNNDAMAVSPGLIESVIAMAPEPPSAPSASKTKLRVTKAGERTWTVPDLLTRNGIGYEERQCGCWRVYNLDRCLTSDAHMDGAAIIEHAGGGLGYKCHHNGCKGKKWEDVRAVLGLKEPHGGDAKAGHATGVSGVSVVSDPGKAGDDMQRIAIPVNNRFMREITADSISALEAVNNGGAPSLYTRGSAIAMLDRTGESPKIALLTQDQLRGMLDRAADYVKITTEVDEQTGELVERRRPARPPLDVTRDVIAQGRYPFPVLNAVAEAPLFLSDGSLLASPGYDPASGIYLDLTGLGSGLRTDIPRDEARRWLCEELLGDFPFADAASMAHTVAMILQPFLRPLIDGPTPLFLIDAPARGTGKGLLTDIAVMVSRGCGADVMAGGLRDEEIEKRITALLMAGVRHILLDNIYDLRSAVLAAVLTTTVWRGRRLGFSEMVSVPNQALWIATGNNVQLSDEMVRRIVAIRLDAQVERPEERSGWRHPSLPTWTRKNRAGLVSACLSIIRAWCQEGMPRYTSTTLGRFESWTEVMGGLLSFLELPGFLCNRDQLHAAADSEGEEWRAVCNLWWERFKEKAITASQLLVALQQKGLLLDVWAGRTSLAAQQRLGHALIERRDRVFGQFIIKSAGRDSTTGSNAFCLIYKTDELQNPRNPGNPGKPHADAPNGQGVLMQNPGKTPVNPGQNPGPPAAPGRQFEGVTGVSGVCVATSGQSENRPAFGASPPPDTLIYEAEGLGWPGITVEDGLSIAGEMAWRNFAIRTSTAAQRIKAMAALKALRAKHQEEPRGPLVGDMVEVLTADGCLMIDTPIEVLEVQERGDGAYCRMYDPVQQKDFWWPSPRCEVKA